jgi:large subunit ribosomal protein L9
MQVYMLQDVEKVGIAGQVIKVSDGYALNYLIPKKLAMKVSTANADVFRKKIKKQTVEKQVLSSKVAMMAERIKSLHLTTKERIHDNGKLYGAISADKIVTLIKEKGFNISKKQVSFDKSIKSVGEHKVTIKLSSKLQPQLTIKVIQKK